MIFEIFFWLFGEHHQKRFIVFEKCKNITIASKYLLSVYSVSINGTKRNNKMSRRAKETEKKPKCFLNKTVYLIYAYIFLLLLLALGVFVRTLKRFFHVVACSVCVSTHIQTTNYLLFTLVSHTSYTEIFLSQQSIHRSLTRKRKAKKRSK